MNSIKELFTKNFNLKNDLIYASPLKRLGSFAIDLIVIMIINNGVLNITSRFGFDTVIRKEEIVLENKGTAEEKLNLKETLNNKTSRNIYFILLSISSLYFILFLSSKKQATIGNQMFKIMVIHSKKAKIGPLIAFIRYIAVLLNNSIYGIGYLLYFFTKDHSFLQDLLSDTRVINLKKD